MENLIEMTEGSATFLATPSVKTANNSTVLTKDAAIFYNPVMKLNRDICLSVLDVMPSDLKVADILAGSGIRSIRILKELSPDKTSLLLVNDNSENFIQNLEKNFLLSGIQPREGISAGNEDAVALLNSLSEKGIYFDYIDIDPFGSPNHFLPSAIKALAKDGILAVTATDTAALCGSSIKACRRKYNAEPLHTSIMNEIGLRILIKHVQVKGLEQKKSLVPVLSYSFKHYMRVYFRQEEVKPAELLEQHNYILYDRTDFTIKITDDKDDAQDKIMFPNMLWAGPVWTGKLNDDDFLRECLLSSHTMKLKEAEELVQQLMEESEVGMIGFYDVHALAEIHKIGDIPKFEIILDVLEEKGIPSCRTHFLNTGIVAKCSGKEFTELLLGLCNLPK